MPPTSPGLSIVPLPSQVERRAGTFTIGPEIVIVADADNQWNATYLHDLLSQPTGFNLPVLAGAPAQASAIRLTTGGDQDILGREGYTLAVSPETITLKAPERTGLFYAIQTLRQLLPVEIEKRTPVSGGAWQVPCVDIEDSPRFGWRGYMMDEGRHFHGKETLLRTLDLMAMQKLNVLHWHLTEDQGWRIEIEQYPKLTQIGAVRAGTARRRFTRQHDGIPHGGFYTQQEITEIVTYAAQRHVTIVPEIEVPGHSLAALAAYPELSCTGGPFQVDCGFGITFDIYCAGKEAVIAFLQDVLDEVVALFPAPYIHIGGDEAPKRRWKRCPDCQRRIRQEGLKDETGLQLYLTNRLAAHLAAHGRRAVVWNDALHPGLEKSVALQYWIRNRQGVMREIRAGRDVVVSSFRETYLDYSYDLTPLSKVYNFEPVFSELDARAAHHVLGLEGPMWTEWVPTRARLDYQTYPRLTALAETGWSPKHRQDYGDFRRRLDVLLRRFDILGIGYAPTADWEPSRLKQLLAIFTLLKAQTKTAEGEHAPWQT
jgi:hexosaminidase